MNRRSVFSGENQLPRTLCAADNEGASATGGGSGATAPSPATGGSSADSGSGASGASTSSSSSPAANGPGTTAPPGAASAAPTTPSSDAAGDPSLAPYDFESLFAGEAPAEMLPAATPEVGVQPQTPVVPGTPPAGAEPAQAAQPTSPASETPSPSSPQETTPSLSPSDPDALARALIQHEAAAIEHLAESAFKFSPEELTALDTDVIGTLPKLMAKVMVKSQQMFMKNLSQIVPAMLDRHATTTAKSKENEDAFFSAWPQLDRTKHSDVVARFARVYRGANPTATREQMMQDVGLMVATHLKLPLQATPNGNGTHVTPSVPAAPRVQPSPWQPAGATPGLGATPTDDPFGYLGKHMDE